MKIQAFHKPNSKAGISDIILVTLSCGVFSRSADPIYDQTAMDALDVGQHDPSS